MSDAGQDMLVRSVSLPVAPALAWSLFVERFSAWWPCAYSFSQDRLAEIGIEPRAGGRCFERDTDGQELSWGKVAAATPPERLVFLWQITADRRIEQNTARASEVEVTFRPAGAGTQVTLTHRAFSRHGGDWRAYLEGMASDQGWTYCLRQFAETSVRIG